MAMARIVRHVAHGFRCVLEQDAGGVQVANGGASSGEQGLPGPGSESVGGEVQIVILKAVYGDLDDPGRQVDITARVAAQLADGRTVIGVENSLAVKDPAPGQAKKLQLEYSVNGARHEKKVGEGCALDLVTGDVFLPISGGGRRAGDRTSNALGMEFCWIPAGEFVMGSPDDEKGRQSIEAQVEVELTRGFWLGRYEVTQQEYEQIVGRNPSRFKESGARAPVEQVNWDEAMAFCAQLTEAEQKAGRLPYDLAYTLPTEAQWEYACRAGETGPFSDGEAEDVAWIKENSGEKTHPVGEKKPNAWGLHDMHGNVWEWCADWYAENLPGGRDPVGPAEGSNRMIRGGAWLHSVSFNRSAKRRYDSSGKRGYALGFRVAVAPAVDVRKPAETGPVAEQAPAPPAEQEPNPEPALAFSVDIITVPGVKERFGAYLGARRKKVADLAGKYGGALENQLTRAVNAGDLTLVTAFRDEKNRIAAFQKDLGDKPGTPEELAAAVWEPLGLAALTGDIAPGLAALRKVWSSETGKIDKELAAALRQSLQILEGELTRARQIEQANKVREFQAELASKGDSAPAGAANVASPASNSSSGREARPADAVSIPGAWTRILEGRNLDGWTVAGDQRSFSIDGVENAVKVSGNPGYLYYSGPVAGAVQFRDFDFRAEVKTTRGGSGGLFFHTLKEGSGFPKRGYEVKINNAVGGDSAKTGSLAEVKTLEKSPVKENQWFQLEVSVRGMEIVIKIDGKEVLRHIEPENFSPPSGVEGRFLREGTFALRCEFSPDGSVMFRKVDVRPWTDALTAACAMKPGAGIERKPPDLRALPKGRLNAWGIGREDKLIDLGDLNRGNDFVRAYVKKDGYWYAFRSRGAIVTNNDRQSRHQDGIADFSLMPWSSPVIIWRDGRLNKKDGMRFAPGMEQGHFVDGAAGEGFYAFLDDQGRVGGNVGDRWLWGMRLPPAGRTDIIELIFAHRTCWCLRSNGQLTWFGSPPRMELSAAQNRNIVAVEASPHSGYSLALNRDGQVYAWNSREQELGPLLKVPEAARSGMRGIRVSHTGDIGAGQNKNGKWIAWGNNQDGIVTKINSLGNDVKDIAFSERLLLWIE